MMIDFEAVLEAFYRQLPIESSTVIDVGAHSGRHAIPLAKQVGGSGIVHAFEPLPTIRTLLVQNLEDAGMGNVIVYPFALASEPGTVNFNYVPELPQESGIKERYQYNDPTVSPQLIEVHAHRLDEFFPQNGVAFLKIDIEGGELDMLHGATRTLTIARPIVSFECGAASFLGYHDRPQEIFAIFEQRGYAVYSILGEQMADAQVFREASYAQAFWDYVAFPIEKTQLARHLSQSA